MKSRQKSSSVRARKWPKPHQRTELVPNKGKISTQHASIPVITFDPFCLHWSCYPSTAHAATAFCLRCEQSRGSNSNAGKMDKIWSIKTQQKLFVRPCTDWFEFFRDFLGYFRVVLSIFKRWPDSGHNLISWTTKLTDLRLTIIFDGFE